MFRVRLTNKAFLAESPEVQILPLSKFSSLLRQSQSYDITTIILLHWRNMMWEKCQHGNTRLWLLFN